MGRPLPDERFGARFSPSTARAVETPAPKGLIGRGGTAARPLGRREAGPLANGAMDGSAATVCGEESRRQAGGIVGGWIKGRS
jgi:hypothetical protein